MSRYTKIEIIVPKTVSESIKSEVGNVTSKRALKKLVSDTSATIHVAENLMGDRNK